MRRTSEEIKTDILKKANQWLMISRLASKANLTYKSGVKLIDELVSEKCLEVRVTPTRARRYPHKNYSVVEYRITTGGIAYLEEKT